MKSRPKDSYVDKKKKQIKRKDRLGLSQGHIVRRYTDFLDLWKYQT